MIRTLLTLGFVSQLAACDRVVVYKDAPRIVVEGVEYQVEAAWFRQKLFVQVSALNTNNTPQTLPAGIGIQNSTAPSECAWGKLDRSKIPKIGSVATPQSNLSAKAGESLLYHCAIPMMKPQKTVGLSGPFGLIELQDRQP
jgi:hypothetical protein